MSLLCLFGHRRRKYVGVQDVKFLDRSPKCRCYSDSARQHCGKCMELVQLIRWICACGAMGEDWVMRGRGIFTVAFGKLIPDEKRWANPNPEETKA